MTTGSNSRSRQHGGALLAVMWLSAALASIALSVSTTVRAETERVENSSNGLRAWYLANGAVERGIQWMVWGEDFRTPENKARYWEPNLPRMNMGFPSGDAIIEMVPESSKLNINLAGPQQLLQVITAVTGDADRARQITEAIIDWRTPAAAPTMFDEYYFGISPTFRARHASFQEIEELLFVRGVTPEIFYGNFTSDDQGRSYAVGGLRDCLSVWGSTGGYDINTVSPALMAASGLPPQAISAIVAKRIAAPFKNVGDLGSLGFPVPNLSVGGNYIWTLRAAARLRAPDGTPSDVVRTAGATVKLLDRQQNQVPVIVLRWYDDAWSESAIVPSRDIRFEQPQQ